MQFLAHNAHNQCKGATFFADHAHLGELYEAYESAYDSLAERTIGLGQDFDPVAIALKAAQFTDPFKDTDTAFKMLVEAEDGLREFIVEANKDASLGTQNLLAQFADDSEARTYKLNQRLV